MPDSASTTPVAQTKKENKTRTIDAESEPQDLAKGRPTAGELGIERVWRAVIDFGEPTSGNGDPDWGRKQISVPRVSLLDGVSEQRRCAKEKR